MNAQELDSISLIKLCTEDLSNHRAWQELVSRFAPRITRYIIRSASRARKQYALLSSQTALIPEVDDLVQQVFLRMIENDCWFLRHLRGETEKAISAYLGIIARSIVLNRYQELCRKKRQHIEYSLDQLRWGRSHLRVAEPTSVHTGDDVEAAFFRKEVIERLYAAVRALYDSPAEANKAIIILDLYFREGLTMREISECPGIDRSPASVARLVSTLHYYLKQYARAHNLKSSL